MISHMKATFRVVSVSDKPNSFGLHGHILMNRAGWHHHANMQVMPSQMNSEKHDDPFWEKRGYKSWRDVPEFLWPAQLISSYRTKLRHHSMVA